MDHLRTTRLIMTALGILFGAAACGPKNPTISYESTSCGDTRTLDLEPGDIVDLSNVGKKSDFEITPDGKIYVPGVSDKITDPNAVDYIIGDQNKPPYYIVSSTGKDNGDVKIERKCPVPAPTPRPTSTPFSYLGKGSGKIASLPSGFHPNSGKPAFSGRIRF